MNIDLSDAEREFLLRICVTSRGYCEINIEDSPGIYLVFENMLTLDKKDIDTMRTLASKLMKSNPEIPCEFK